MIKCLGLVDKTRSCASKADGRATVPADARVDLPDQGLLLVQVVHAVRWVILGARKANLLHQQQAQTRGCEGQARHKGRQDDTAAPTWPDITCTMLAELEVPRPLQLQG